MENYRKSVVDIELCKICDRELHRICGTCRHPTEFVIDRE